jgi:signal transduction histidine kinase
MVLVLFILLAVVDFQQHRRLTEEEFIKRVETIVVNLAETSRVAVLTGDKQLVETVMKSVTGAEDFAYVWIYGENWNPLYNHAAAHSKFSRQREALSDVEKARLSGQGLSHVDGSEGNGGERLVELLAPITMAEPESAYELLTGTPEQISTAKAPVKRPVIRAVRLGLSLKEVDAHMASLLKWRAGLFAVFLCLSALAVYFLAGRITRPVLELTNQVNKISQGDLDQRIAVSSNDEIGGLAASFNGMARSLKELYTGLEQKVAARTQQLSAANQKLEEANKHKSEFLANVNHELRTPVSAIISYARLILRGTEVQISRLQTENLQDLLRNAERLLSQIDSLLEFSKIEAGKMELRLEPVNVDKVIEGAISNVEPTLNGVSIRIMRAIDSDMLVVNTDREKLRQIILNLLDNAVKFTERGEIKIAVSQQNGSVKLAVSDTGIGIEKEDLSKIFEEFQRGDSFSARIYRGTGLGLAIVKKFVNLLGGEVGVKSEVGQGSVFTVTLPLENSFNENSEITLARSPEESRGGGTT